MPDGANPGADVARQIAAGSAKGGKTYAFDERHDRRLPAQMWFQESVEGPVLFIVFYTQACRWSRCLGCNLPSKASQFHVGYKDIVLQIDHVFADPEVLRRREGIRKVIVSNNGSVLDERTFSSTALMYLMARINMGLPNLSTLTIETRPEYVDVAELEFLSRALKEGETPTDLELAVGFEAFDERVRNAVFQKGLSLAKFEELVGKIAPYGYMLKCYFMQKPVPGMSDEEAVADICRALDYLGSVARARGVRINMHLNPTFVSAGTPLEAGFRRGQYVPPRLADVARAALHAEGKGITVFIGLFDEGLAVQGGSFVREGEEALVRRLEEFNRTQDYRILRDLPRAEQR